MCWSTRSEVSHTNEPRLQFLHVLNGLFCAMRLNLPNLPWNIYVVPQRETNVGVPRCGFLFESVDLSAGLSQLLQQLLLLLVQFLSRLSLRQEISLVDLSLRECDDSGSLHNQNDNRRESVPLDCNYPGSRFRPSLSFWPISCELVTMWSVSVIAWCTQWCADKHAICWTEDKTDEASQHWFQMLH